MLCTSSYYKDIGYGKLLYSSYIKDKFRLVACGWTRNGTLESMKEVDIKTCYKGRYFGKKYNIVIRHNKF